MVNRWYPSRLKTYLWCGEKYRRKYIEHERIPLRKIPLIVGNAIHAGAEEDNIEKIRTQEKGLNKEDIVEISVETYQSIIDEGEMDEGTKEIGKAKDSCVNGAELYADQVSPVTKPIHAEEEIVADVIGPDGNTYQLAGILDVVEDGAVGDLKTGSKAWNQGNIDAADQLTLYGILYRSRYGEYPSSLWVANLVNRVSGWKYNHLETSRSTEQYMNLMNKIILVEKGINSGTFLPAAEGSWFCSQKWCEFWASCPFAQGK